MVFPNVAVGSAEVVFPVMAVKLIEVVVAVVVTGFYRNYGNRALVLTKWKCQLL